MLSYTPASYRCCQHNVSHGWPYYAEELWLATGDRGLCVSLYAASEVTAKVGDGTVVTVAEATDYPFSDGVELKLAMARNVRFPLYLRIPRWCRGAGVRINGQETPLAAEPLSYVRIERQWAPGDTVLLRLPMTLGVRTWPKNHDSVSVDYGPLTFSLEIGEKWSRYGGTDKWPEFEVFPTTPWNYGLVLDEKAPASSFKLTRSPGPLAAQPFMPQAAPIRLQVKARKIPRWILDGKGIVGALQASPAWTDEPIETVTLIPMGAARLRIRAFPTVSTAPDAHHWDDAPGFWASASSAVAADYTDALNNGSKPASSHDATIPRFTWGDHRGTVEWVQYDFAPTRKVRQWRSTGLTRTKLAAAACRRRGSFSIRTGRSGNRSKLPPATRPRPTASIGPRFIPSRRAGCGSWCNCNRASLVVYCNGSWSSSSPVLDSLDPVLDPCGVD